MTDLDKSALECIIDLTNLIHNTKNDAELIQCIKIEFDIVVTMQDLTDHYNRVETQFCFNDLDCEDYRINYLTCAR